jgi:hypothetical protein
VQDALAPTGIPAFAGAWKPTETQPSAPAQYLVYTTLTAEDEHWDDLLRRCRVYVYLNLWSETDPTAVISAVRAAMRRGGFALVEESDDYDADARRTRVSWTWVIRTEEEP